MMSSVGDQAGSGNGAGHPPALSVAKERRKSGVIRILADDHLMFREGLLALFRRTPGFEVVGEASDGETAVTLAFRLMPDLLLLDLAMPRRDGMSVLQELSNAAIPVRVLVLASVIDSGIFLQVVQLGARGFPLKSATGETLLESIRQVMAGHCWIERDGVTDLVDAIRSLSRHANHSNGNYGLTRRERQTIAAVVGGYSNYEIAQKFSLSEQTVKHHLTSVFDKLGTFNRLELALFAIKHRIAAPED